MICPKCAYEYSAVLKTLKSLTTMRWRKCAKCGYTWVTEEKPKGDSYLIDYLEEIDKPEKKEPKR